MERLRCISGSMASTRAVIDWGTVCAFLAAKLESDHGLAALGIQHPLTLDQRWVMPDVLVVAAGQLRNPVTLVVGMKAPNRLAFIGIDPLSHDAFSQSGIMPSVELTSCWMVTPAKAFSVAA